MKLKSYNFFILFFVLLNSVLLMYNQYTDFTFVKFSYLLYIPIILLSVYQISKIKFNIKLFLILFLLVTLLILNYVFADKDHDLVLFNIVTYLYYFTFIFIFIYIVKCFPEQTQASFLHLTLLSLMPYFIFFVVVISQYRLNFDDRFSLIGHPNQLAEIFIFIGILSVMFQKWFFRLLLILSVIFLLYATQARGAFLSYFIFLTLFYHELFWKYKWIIIFIFFISLNFIMYEILLIDDPYRGLGTGLTGRIDVFIEGWNLFLQSPFLGIGTGLTNIHNGFLKILVENGIFFFAIIMLLIIRASFLLSLKSSSIVMKFFSSYFVAYLITISFAPRLINLNLYSLFFLYSLLYIFYSKKYFIYSKLDNMIKNKCY